MRHVLAAASISLGSLVPAQTFVVDVTNGPGTNYTSIQAAVAAVPGGSTLLVRPGTYGPVVIDAKGVTILCEPNVVAGGTAQTPRFLTIRNTQPGQTVTVRGLDCEANPWSTGLLVDNTLGATTYDGGVITFASGTTDAITLQNASQVAIKNVQISQATARVSNSEVVFEQCILRGRDASWFGSVPALAAVTAVNSRVQLVHSTVLGADGVFVLLKPQPVILLPGGPAVEMVSSSLRATGTSSHSLVGGVTPAHTSPSVQLPSIVGTGTARVHPQMTMNPAAASIALTRPVMPSLLTTTAPLGGTLSASRFGPPNVWCAVALSLRGPSVLPPWSSDPIWLDATTLSVEALAQAPAIGPVVAQKAVPNVASLRGFQLVWQAADLTPTGIEVGNPSPSYVR